MTLFTSLRGSAPTQTGSSSSGRTADTTTSSSSLVDKHTMGGGQNWIDISLKIVTLTAQIGLSYYLMTKTTQLMQSILNGKDGGLDVAKMKRDLAKRLRRPEIEVMDLNAHEARLSQDCIASEDIDVSFADIGGMEAELEIVKDNIILPMQMSRMQGYKGVLKCPTGALLFGRPGTGKTMTAKALAKEAKATFINVKASSVMDKWLGESDKMAAAIFSLARKLSPTIIFIDEIDTLLKNRDSGGDNSAHATMQGVFLSEWDGLTGQQQLVVVLGATNRPQSLDKAFLRRMPVMVKVSPPNLAGRVDILKRQLTGEALDHDVLLEEIAMQTENFTGSDLRELVRVASLQRAKQLVADLKKIAEEDAEQGGDKKSAGGGMRPLSTEDFNFALGKIRITDKVANDYATELLLEQSRTQADIARRVLKGLTDKDSDE